MKYLINRSKILKIVASSTVVAAALAGIAFADHSWGNYHWARTSNSFTLKLGDNVSSAWEPYLFKASADWSLSTVLDTDIVTGSTKPKPCKPKLGRVEVCNSAYGYTGWLGVAQIWASGDHIVQGTAKVNDTYFKYSQYNTSAWKRLVMCQEIAHTFGLDHQDEKLDNLNLGTCMDYTSNPDGPPSNERPNAHDYDQLELIYKHLDTTTTVGQTSSTGPGNHALNGADGANSSEWGKSIRTSSDGKPSLYVRDLGNGNKVFTFVIWADEARDARK